MVVTHEYPCDIIHLLHGSKQSGVEHRGTGRFLPRTDDGGRLVLYGGVVFRKRNVEEGQ